MKRHASMNRICRLVGRETRGAVDRRAMNKPAACFPGWQLLLKAMTATLLVSVSALSAAQSAPPKAGAILHEIQQVVPPLPAPGGTGLAVEPQDAGQLPAGDPFPVNKLIVSGNSAFDTPTLHALVADAEGRNLTLRQLGEVVARITEYYRDHGYPLARAIIPAQTIEAGVVRVVVVEARYGKITLANRSAVNESLLQATLAPLREGQAVSQADLDRSLLLLSDIPGVRRSATLSPGERVGSSDLAVEADGGPALAGMATLDGYGNHLSGRERLGATVMFNNPLHRGDILTLSGLTAGQGLNYGRIAYETLLNGQGTRAGAAFMALDYVLGDTFARLKAHGSALVDSLWVRHPLLRGTQANVYGQVQFDRKVLRDRVDVSHVQTDRHLGNWTATLSGDAASLGGVSTGSIGWTAGRLGFDDTAAQLSDAATARTAGRFTHWNASAARLQGLGARNELYVGLTAQWANTNLDSSEKMFAGGPYSVRAYDVSALSGDSGVLATVEFRRDLGANAIGQWQAVAFIDSARLVLNANNWSAAKNTATLSGAGLGFNLTVADQWRARAFLATPIGQIPTQLGSTRSTRAWLEVGKSF